MLFYNLITIDFLNVQLVLFCLLCLARTSPTQMGKMSSESVAGAAILSVIFMSITISVAPLPSSATPDSSSELCEPNQVPLCMKEWMPQSLRLEGRQWMQWMLDDEHIWQSTSRVNYAGAVNQSEAAKETAKWLSLLDMSFPCHTFEVFSCALFSPLHVLLLRTGHS